MAEVLVEFGDVISATDGRRFAAQACGREGDDGRWQGWIEFLPLEPGPPVRSGRETTQPNRQDALYWATGLTPVYLEGALRRALTARDVPASAPPVTPAFDGPAPEPATTPPAGESILNPFSVHRKGEALLRRQLGALSAWHLVNIITVHGLSSEPASELNRRTPDTLIEVIVAGVRRAADPSAATQNDQ